MIFRAALGLSVALALAGCEMAPLYHPPNVALPSQFSDAGGAAGGVLPPSGEWWRSFNDRRLDTLEADVDAANPNLAAAFAAYEFAKARAAAATAGLFPEVDFGGGLSANKQSDNRPLRSKSQPTYYGANQIAASVAGYELDVWGRVADLVKASKLDAEAAGAALANARIGLHAELARDYVDLRGLDAQAKFLADTIKVYQSALDLTQQRLNAKIAPPIDAESTQSQAAAAAARKALDMSMALYRDGAASYLDVVTAQDQMLLAERAAIGVRNSQLDAYVGLMLALGGGWTIPPEDKVIPKILAKQP